MALGDSPVKSVGIIMAIALIGIIIVIATVNLQNRNNAPTASSTVPFLQEESGVVFVAPVDWTVGKTAASTLEVHGTRIHDIRTQRSTCNVASAELTNTMHQLLSTGSEDATTKWLQQYPGMVTSQILKGPTTLFSIVGIDTCNPSFSVRTLTFRGQVYKNDVEVQISHQIMQSGNLSPTELETIAKSLADGTAADELQQPFNQFVTVLGSVR